MKRLTRWHVAALAFGLVLGAVAGFLVGSSTRGRARAELAAVPPGTPEPAVREAPRPVTPARPEPAPAALPASKAAPPPVPTPTPKVERPAPKPPQAEPPRKPKADILEVAIEVNRLLEPELDEPVLRKALRGLADQAKGALAGAKSDEEKVAALNRTLLADRQVTYLSNLRWRDVSLAAATLRKKGNCLATTTLYVVVGKVLGLPVHAVTIPIHAFARFEGQRPINIETTAQGKHTPDSQLRYEFDFGDEEARDFGYGKSLSEDEFAGLLLLEAAGHLDSVGKPAEASALVERAGSLWPGNLMVAFQRAGLLYLDQPRREEALDFFRRIAQKPGAYSRTAQARAVLALAQHAHAVGNQAQALGLSRAAFSCAPRTSQVEVLALMSTCHRSERDFSAAALAQELSLVLRPEPQAFTALGIMYKNAGRLDQAIRVLRQALTLNPEDWNTRLILAGYLIRAGQADEGWRVFDTVHPPRTDLQFYHTNMAWFFASMRKRRDFLRHLEQALALSQSPEILTYIAAEVDFDPYRADPDFQRLVETHRRRLLGDQPRPPGPK